MAEIKETLNKPRKNNNFGTVPLSDIFFMTVHHWPWILLSVFICVGVAYVYLLRTPNVYSRSAEILVKDDSKGQSTGADEFANLGLFQSKTNIQNEMTNLKAKDLTEEVVRRLGLDINYYHSGRFHDVVAYGCDLPVKLAVSDYPDEGSFSLELSVAADGTVSIKNLEEPGRETFKQTFTGMLNDTIATPVGKMTVSPSSNYRNGEDISLIIKKWPLSAARDSYNGRLAVTMSNDKGTVLKLTFADQSPQRADDVLSTLIGVYNENWIRDKNQIAVSTSNFINDRLGVIEGELGNVDSDISSYKSANLVPDVGAAAAMYMNQSQQTQAQILEVNNQLSMARYIRSYLTADGNGEQLLPANTGLQSSNIQSLIGEYNEKLLQRNALVAKSSEKNPLVIQLDEQLSAQRQAVVRTIDNEIIALNTQLKSLRGSEAQTMSRLASNPTQAKNLLSTERQQKVKESLYLFLLQKREENELSQAFTAYNTRIVNKPGASGVPPTPNRRNILAMAFLIGLAIPFGVTYVRETNNTKVRGRKDIEHLAVPFLGEIPQYTKESRKKSNAEAQKTNSVVVKEGKRDIINEAFRVLRTNVEFMCGSTPGAKVIAFTSFNPGSGKSFISVNLGMSIALKRKKVLIIDGDMRHGSTSAYIGSPSLGLSNYLSGSENDISKVIVRDTVCDTLFYLPVGSIPPNPTELLESSRLSDLIRTAKEEFDYIIIDCPPIEVVADAQIIDRYADRTFFIIRAGLLERAILPDLDRLYEEKKYRNMAFVLNGTRNDQGRYGYSHSYRYGYGYGYGYGYNYGSDGKKR
ncbi:GumC family protein [Xylanibacter rodentium]|uniref:GumC family protein n=1 Tax=Xylanibacter rodentium TaxID=2736289 RepID=UPI002599F7F0|nr:tyrosine-protein kinase domain-containing protein [Xylanibacter rodentium]